MIVFDRIIKEYKKKDSSFLTQLSRNIHSERKKQLTQLEKKIKIKFNHLSFLEKALTHSSYSNQSNHLKSNQRLEFFGDAILNFIVAEYLFSNNLKDSEGTLSKNRAFIVSQKFLNFISNLLQLGDYLNIGKGEKREHISKQASVLEDTLEALIAAIYIDQGMTKCKQFVHRFILNQVDYWIDTTEKNKEDNYKSILQEHLQLQGKNLPIYVVDKVQGPSHNSYFYSSVFIDNIIKGKGEGHSKKESQMMAAKNALKNLK